jgi:hypothetical protein
VAEPKGLDDPGTRVVTHAQFIIAVTNDNVRVALRKHLIRRGLGLWVSVVTVVVNKEG